MASAQKFFGVLLATLIVIACSLVSCGVKGPPEPPYPNEAMYKGKPIPAPTPQPVQVVEPLPPADAAAKKKSTATPFSTKKIKSNKAKTDQ